MKNTVAKTPEIIDVNPEDIKHVDASIPEQNQCAVATIDAEAKEVESNEDTASDIFIKTVTPYRLIFNKKEGRDIAIIIFLCKDDNDKLFIIDRNIVIHSTEQISDLQCLPFAEDKEIDFVNQRICANILMGGLDNYVCDMKFNISKDDMMNNLSPVLTTNLTNVKTREIKQASINADTFAALTFIDSYIKEDIINEHDLALAVMAGSKDCTSNPAEFFVVDSVDKIVAMAPAEVDMDNEKRGIIARIKAFFTHEEPVDHSTSIGLVAKLARYKGGERETLCLLTPFDIGVEFEEDKFKGNTISSIESEYFGDSDQYVSTLVNSKITIEGVDKTYMMIRAKSKTGSVKLFLLDSVVQKDLQEKINEY